MNWLAAIFFPAVLAGLMAVPSARSLVVRWLMPIAALPALALALLQPAEQTSRVSWLLLGTTFGFGAAGQVFLFFTALLWTFAALFATSYMTRDARRDRFAFFFLLSMSGNLGLLAARDAASFYTFFALMAFAAYPLVIHSGTDEARRAGRVYLVMTIVGEAFLLAGLLMAARVADSILFEDIQRALGRAGAKDWILLCLLIGFGVKAGAFLVHFWLPLAHPVAPVPASAVLSGAMIKAGLIGWINVLPLGQGAFPGWSSIFMGLGIMAAFYGVIIGLMQDDPKTNLAYSSISQMGAMTLALGIGLSHPDAWAPVLAVLLVYAMNHAFAKGALFLGVGIALHPAAMRWKQHLFIAGLCLPALALAGAPWTGGAVAKYGLKTAAGISPSTWYPALHWILPLASVATTLLLTRFVLLIARKLRVEHAEPASVPSLGLVWAGLLACVAAAGAWVIRHFAIEIKAVPFAVGEIWAAIWPVALGVMALIGASRLLGRRLHLRMPAGDLLIVIERGVRLLKQAWNRVPGSSPVSWQINLMKAFDRLAAAEKKRELGSRGERALRRWDVAGVSLLLVLLSLLILLLSNPP